MSTANETRGSDVPWWEAYLVEHPERRTMRCRHAGCEGPSNCGCCRSMMIEIDMDIDY